MVAEPRTDGVPSLAVPRPESHRESIADILSRRRFLALSVGGGLGGAMAALAGRHTTMTVSGRILRIQNDGDIRNLDPANRPGWYDEVVMFAIFSGLCQYRPGKVWGWQLDAAESLSQPDPLNIPFKLRPGIKWTGGFGEVTAEDVKYSYERFFDPRVHANYKTDWEALDEVVVSDRYSGVIRLKHPFSPLFASTLPHASGLIVCKEAVEAAGGLFTTAPPATSGPYRIGSWKPRERLVLVRHELWNGPSPCYDEIHLLPMNWTEGETAFDAGDLDMTRINVGSIPVVTAAKRPGVELMILPGLAYDWLGMNLANPKLQDIRIRRAIQRAINIPSLLQAVFGGLVPQAFGVVPPPLVGARTQDLYSYDPAESRRLLGEAGVSGLKLRLDLSQVEEHLNAAQVIQSDLAQIGIEVQLRQMDPESFIALHQNTQSKEWLETELHLQHSTTGPDASWVTPWFTCSQVGSWNFEHHCDPAWDTMSGDAVLELDPEKRAALYGKLQDALEETGGYLFLYHGLNAWLTRSPVQGAWSPDGQWALLREVSKGDASSDGQG